MMKVSSSSIQRPLILSNHSQLPPKLFAYYSVYWEHNQSNNSIDHNNNNNDDDIHFEINSCLYFQNTNQKTDDINDNNDNDNELEETREDGCGYVITYPPHIRPTDNLQIYNFDRTKTNSLNSKNKKKYDLLIK